ncbi:protoporphyrinogen oxidase [Deltaproteobacteria bacterium]|nr:protoporphyrinogen oxidase [Deltaproteobacteria bacterium]
MSRAVVVVGGGLAGVSAAMRLRELGAQVRIVDPGVLGGTARTAEPVPGWKIELGPHTFTHRSAELVGLLARLGLRDEIVPLGAGAKVRFLRRGGALCANARALRLGEMWSLFWGLFSRAETAPDADMRAWASARFGPRVADEVVAAFVTGIWAAAPEELEMASAFPMLEALTRAEGSVFGALRAIRQSGVQPPLTAGTWTVRGGLGRIGEAAETALSGERDHGRVLGVSRRGTGWCVDTNEGEVEGDQIVCALPTWQAAPLMAPHSASVAEGLGSVKYSPILAAHWLSPDSAFPAGFGYLAGPAEGAKVLGTLFTSDLFPERTPAGFRSGATLLGGTRDPEAVNLDDQGARARIEEEHRQLTGRTLTFEHMHLVRHARAVAVPAPGHAELRRRLHASLPEGLALAGAWDGSGAMEDAARSGREAADRLMGAA